MPPCDVHDGFQRTDHETMAPMPKKDADAYDRLLDAAAQLADMIASAGIDIEEEALEALTIFLAEHGLVVNRILKNLRRVWP
jgi:dsDNA-binding SOS-regulon protein